VVAAGLAGRTVIAEDAACGVELTDSNDSNAVGGRLDDGAHGGARQVE
jgi:hypothetical protein